MKIIYNSFAQRFCLSIFFLCCFQMFARMIKISVANNLMYWEYPVALNSKPFNGRLIWTAFNSKSNSSESTEDNPTSLGNVTVMGPVSDNSGKSHWEVTTDRNYRDDKETGNTTLVNNLVYKTGYKVPNLHINTVCPKLDCSLIENYAPTYKNIQLQNNRAVAVSGTLKTNDCYNNFPDTMGKRKGYQNAANIQQDEVEIHSDTSFAFDAWKKRVKNSILENNEEIEVTIRAKGLRKNEVVYLMENDIVLGSWIIDVTSYSNFSAKIKKPSGTSLKLYFNGISDVQIDYLKVQNTIYQAENYRNTASWSSKGGCGTAKSEWMYCDGSIFFTDLKITEPKTTSNIIIKADENLVSEDITRIFNNSIFTYYNNIPVTGADHKFITKTPVASATQIVFPGYEKSTEDLTIDGFSINDKIYKSKDQKNTMETWVPRKGYENNMGEILHFPRHVIYNFSDFKRLDALPSFSDQKSFKLYPNPASHNLTIQGTGFFTYRIFNLRGLIIKKATATYQVDVNTINFAKGIYLVELNVNNSIITKKLIIGN